MTTLICTALGAIISAWFFRIERTLVGINEDLAIINANLAEASTEIVDRIAQLEAAVAAGEVVDPALLAAVRQRAVELAGIVPNAFEAPGGDAATEPTVEPES